MDLSLVDFNVMMLMLELILWYRWRRVLEMSENDV